MQMIRGLSTTGRPTKPCALCDKLGAAAITRPARVCWSCWREMGARRRKEIRDATAQ